MQKPEMAQHLANLKAREQKTRDAEIRLKTQLENLEAEEAIARKEAIQEFGTDDLAQLREMYRKAAEEDQRALQEYEDTLVLREQLIDTITKNIEGLRLN